MPYVHPTSCLAQRLAPILENVDLTVKRLSQFRLKIRLTILLMEITEWQGQVTVSPA